MPLFFGGDGRPYKKRSQVWSLNIILPQNYEFHHPWSLVRLLSSSAVQSQYTQATTSARNYRATKCLQTTLQLNTARHNYEYEVVQQHYTKFLQHNKTRHKTQHNGYLNASISQFENFRNTWRLRKNPPFRKSCLHNASSV